MIKDLTSIVIVAYNQLSYTRRCVESVLRNTEVPYELILVDNGSSDGTTAYFKELERKHSHIRSIVRKDNHGSCARNFGFEKCRGEFVAILDNDTEVGSGWLPPLLRFFSDPTIGAVGHEGVLLDDDFEHRLHTASLPSEQVDGMRVDLLTGYCCVFRNLFKRIGYFDWGYAPFWNEEADFCLRIKHLGYSILAKRTAVVHHAHRTGFVHTDVQKQMTKNTEYMKEKWRPYKKEILECYRDETFDGLKKIKNTPFKVEIGSGDHPLPGYLHLDVRPLKHVEFVADARRLPFDDQSVDQLAAYNILEHIPRAEVVPLLKEWRRVLRPGGFLEIFGPNLHGYVQSFCRGKDGWDFERFETWVYGHEDYEENFHKVGFSVDTMQTMLYEAGFEQVERINHPDAEAICVHAYKGGS